MRAVPRRGCRGAHRKWVARIRRADEREVRGEVRRPQNVHARGVERAADKPQARSEPEQCTPLAFGDAIPRDVPVDVSIVSVRVRGLVCGKLWLAVREGVVDDLQQDVRGQ